MFTAFLPGASKDALKSMSEELHSWRIHLRSGTELKDIAAWVNPVIRGWMTYYGSAGSSSTLRRRFFTCESTVRS